MVPQRRLAAWLLRHLPETVAAAPERVLLNLSCMLIGLSVLVGDRSPALDRLWPTPLYEWAVSMLFGGGAVLVGMFAHKRTLERLGLILLIIGCLIYGFLLVAVFGHSGGITAAIFFALAGAKAIRLFVSSAARDTAIRWGEQMKENPHPDEET